MEDYYWILAVILFLVIGYIAAYLLQMGFGKILSFIFNVFTLNKRKKINTVQETIASDFIKKMEKVSDWYEIIKERGNGQLMYEKSMGIKVDNYEYWANAHKEEYMLKYNDGNLDVKGIKLRIDKFGFILSELDKLIRDSKELKLNINSKIFNNYCAAKASVLGAEYALKEMNGEEKKTIKPKTGKELNSAFTKNILFKNLKGINFELIDFNPKGKFTANPETFFNIDIDGKWYFTQNQMVFLFKAFSFGTFDNSLNDLLKANKLKPNDFKEVGDIKFWYGNGFKIEVPPVMGKAKHIMITNEDIVPKNSLEFQTTKLVKTTHNVNWVNGLIPYDGAELLKKDFQLNNSLNVPALFKEDGDEYIMIKATTETVAKELIDKIINANGGLDNFSKGSEPGWFYPHACEAFTVGYLIEHKVVRLNKN